MNKCTPDRKKVVSNSRQNMVRKVAVPSALMDEIIAADLRGLTKDVIYWIVYRCTTTRARCCEIDQPLLDVSVSHRIRKQVVDFIKSSRYIRAASNGFYRSKTKTNAGQCRRYELHNIPVFSEDMDQHNNGRRSADRSGVAVVVGDVVWRSVDFSDLWERAKKGFLKKNWGKSTKQAEWSLSQIDEATLTEPEIVATVGEGKQADAHVHAYRRYQAMPENCVFRRDGRTYSPVTSLPKWIREREIQFGGESESLDVSCCYLWCLAGDHRLSRIRRGLDTTEIDRLMDLIEAGDFYKKIAEIAGVETDTAKEDFNQFCLFGPIGWHPLWRALRSISPGICDDIRWWRSQAGGATRLAYFLQRCECQLMTDGVLDWLISGGVPAVQVHDGAIVPGGVADIAAQWLSDHSLRLYGRRCRISVTTAQGKSHV